MPKNPYTKKHINQFRGPAHSDVFNDNGEDIHQDLTYLFNALNELNADIDEGHSAVTKDLLGISKEIEDLKNDISSIQTGTKIIVYSGNELDDTDRFDGVTTFEVAEIDKLHYDNRYHIYTIPRILNSSISRLKFNDVNGQAAVPPSLKIVVSPDETSEDKGTNVRSSLPYDAIVGDPGKVWERNVLSDNPTGTAIVDLIFNLPDDLTASEYANVINLIPFPLYDVDVLAIYYSIDVSPTLSLTGANWTPLNKYSNYYNDSSAVGEIPPGAWTGDAIVGCGPVSFVFPNERITAMRITLRQQNPYDGTSDISLNKYIYTYGLSHLDVRYEKFNERGKLIFKLEPNGSDTISSISTVTPHIYNVPNAALTNVFSYRILWETAFDSGVYTTTPVPLSNRVWLEITLRKDSSENLPALTGFRVEYS